MIFKQGTNRGLACFLASISAWRLSRILFAMAVPSIFWAPMVTREVEKCALPDTNGDDEVGGTERGKEKPPSRTNGRREKEASDKGPAAATVADKL